MSNQETTRLAEIKHLDEGVLFEVLDKIPENEFEDLLNVACSITGCRYARIHISGEEQKWFQEINGNIKDEDHDIFYELVLAGDDHLIIPDIKKDHRFSEYSDRLNTEGMISYFGIPVYYFNNKKIGAISVIAGKPHQPTDSEVSGFRLISRHITYILQSKVAHMFDKEQSQHALFENDRHFQSFFSKGMLPKWIYEVETLRFLQVNDAAIEKYGYTKEEFMQMSVFDIRTAETKKTIHQLVQQVKGNNNECTFRSWHQTKDGRKLDVEVTIHDIVYMGIPARVATMIDITEKQNLEKALELERKAIDERVTQAELTAIRETKDFIGKELHDNINQLLVSIKLYLDFALKNEDMRVELMHNCKDIVDEAIQSIRQLTNSLVIEETEFLLKENLEELVGSFSRVNSFRINLSVEDAIEEFPADLKLNLFRIIQEQLNNIIKYANATEVWITIQCKEHLQLQVKDNGVGFNARKKRSGIGLRNIQRRAEFYKGSMEIGSSASKGTVVMIKLPLLEVG